MTATLQRALRAAEAKIARLEAKIARLESAWTLDASQWPSHVQRYKHRRAVEAAARKHGAELGPAFVELLAARLVAVDVDRDGARLSLETARRSVSTWAREGSASAPAKIGNNEPRGRR